MLRVKQFLRREYYSKKSVKKKLEKKLSSFIQGMRLTLLIFLTYMRKMKKANPRESDSNDFERQGTSFKGMSGTLLRSIRATVHSVVEKNIKINGTFSIC